MSKSSKCRAKNPSTCRVHGTAVGVQQYYNAKPAEFGGNRKADPLRLAQSQVLARDGWTLSAVREFLGEPDALRKNPKYATAPRMKMYDLTRVEGVEGTEEFNDFTKRNSSRVAAAQKAGAKRSAGVRAEKARAEAKIQAELEEYMENAEVHVEPLPRSLAELREQAIRSYNAGSERTASIRDDVSFLNRITVNFLRHEKTNYDVLVGGLWSFPTQDTRDAVYELKSNVHSALRQRLPESVVAELMREFSDQDARAESDSFAASFTN